MPTTLRQPAPTTLLIVACALLALAGGAYVLPATTIHTASMQDLVVHLDLTHRLDMGQTPYVDFHAPIGWLAMWLLWAGQWMQDGFGGATEAADWLMLCAVLPLAAIALARRVGLAPALTIMAALAGMVIAPWRIGYDGWHPDPGLHYNQWGWALLSVTMLLWLPGQAARRRRIADALAVGALLSLLFFTKLSYFAAALGFVCLFGLMRRESHASALAGIALFGACVLTVQAAGGWVDDYIQENLRIWEVGQNAIKGDGGYASASLWRILHTAHADIAILILCCAAARWMGQWRRSMALHAGFALAAGAWVMMQSSSAPEFMLVVSASLLRLAVSAPPQSATRRTAYAGMALHLAPVFAKQALASVVFWFAAMGSLPHLAVDLPRLDNVLAGSLSRMAANGEYLDTLRSGLELLRTVDADAGPVAVMDVVNPFPVILNAMPPKGVVYAIHINRMVGRKAVADPSMVFGDALWLLEPKLPVQQDTLELIQELQAERLAAEWRQVAENEHWILRRLAASANLRIETH